MRYLAAALVFLLTVSFTAQETITYPYNPDVDSDSYVGITDLIELLSIYSYYFEAGEIMVNDTTLSSYLNELTLLLEAAALPEGTSDGQFLKWNGTEWVLVMPSVGCTDAEACNYNLDATVTDEDKCIYQDACGVCDGPGEIYECGCSDIPEGDCDCDGNQVDALNVCGGECAADEDGDGICDDGDSCIGEADECGVCNGPGAIYDCGCTEPAPDTCDCEGNVVDAVGECGGGCQEDADEDGICDSQDDCVGEFDECGVCNGPGPILGCGCENIPEGDCDCQGNQLDAVGTCGGACQTDVNGDGVCDDDSIPGCTYEVACNYDPSASINDGSCDFTSCYGCTDPTACNYSGAAYIDNQSCWYVSFALDCENNCLNDSDGDGYCDELEIYGCTDEEYACNYDIAATELDDSCTYPGCTDSTACNFDPAAGCDDGSCVEVGDTGCIDSIACNFDETAICGDNSCTYEGCTNPLASNYDETAGCDDGSCMVYGCVFDLACNYEPTANIDDDSCEFGTCPGCADSEASNYNPTSTNDEICEYSDTFTNCGQEGRYGPSIEQVNQEYGAGNGITVINGIQYWTVPESGTYRIEAFGARGGYGGSRAGGAGAKMTGYFELEESTIIQIVVGQKGLSASYSGGGGGASILYYSVIDEYPLIMAAGGSGGNQDCDNGAIGLASMESNFGVDCYTTFFETAPIGHGGIINPHNNYGGGAGAGWWSNGMDFDELPGNHDGGANGGNSGAEGVGAPWVGGDTPNGGLGGDGGFGGGGGGAQNCGGSGAGAGFTGGTGQSCNSTSGGGGSYNSGTSQDNESGVNEGHGKVVITLIP